jgi:hypothetical protein
MTTAVGSRYTDWERPALVAELDRRKLSSVGTDEALRARLTKSDPDPGDDDPLGLDDDQPPRVVEPGQPADDVPIGPSKVDIKPVDGAYTVGEGARGMVRVYRKEFPIGDRPLDDDHHFHLIAQTHEAALNAGHQSKGGPTIGKRLGYSRSASGERTVVYEVPLRRQ